MELDDQATYEIIVADDASTDSTADQIASLGGVVRLARQEQNLGFLRNCNSAATLARGQHIVFLNNDTIVLSGWLDALLAPFEADESVGFAGSKLLNSDGSLQEAGGVFWSDGSAWNFGRNQDPRMPEFNYLKDVDYCSGASIAMPRRVWNDLGGFDPLFDPAYCEDSDIAFRVRARGMRTVYAPHSALVHHEGRSHGRDVASGVKAYQVTNMQKLFARWRSTLEAENFANGEQVPLARDRSRRKPHILVVDHYVPQWDRDAGSRSTYHYIKLLLESGFHVTLWPDNLHEDRTYTAPLQAMGVEVIYSNFGGGFSEWLRQNGAFYKYAFLNRPHIAEKYVDALDQLPNITKMYYGHDLHFLRLEQQMLVTGFSKKLEHEIAYWKEKERAVCLRCDVIFYPGFEEVKAVEEWVEEDVLVLALPLNIFSDEETQIGRERVTATGADPYSLMFVGGFTHTPNVESIIWFVREVMPLLTAKDSRYRLSIAGTNAPQSVMDLAGGSVEFLGRVSDAELAELYEESGIAVVPLLYGGGVKGKVTEAMVKGVPLAMTSVGAQGITGAEEMAFIGDKPDELAEQIFLMTSDQNERSRRAMAALNFIEKNYSLDAVRTLLGQAIPELLQKDLHATGR
jgi:GT2 family glycosyltransferase